MKKKTLFAFILIIAFIFITGCGKKEYGLNETVTVKSNNIKITVLAVEDYKLENAEFEVANGDYTRVKVKIENNGDKDFGYSTFSFKLGDQVISFAAIAEKDALPSIVAKKQSAEGYLYFPKTESRILTYTTLIEVDTEQETVTFNLK